MIGPADIDQWALNVWSDYLRSVIDGAAFFPIRKDRLGRVPAAASPQEFSDAVTPLWNGSKQARGYGYTVILEERQRRSRMLQNEPIAVVFESEEDYLRLLDRAPEVERFRTDLALIRNAVSEAVGALRLRPEMIVESHGRWPGILCVVDYLRKHPRPGCYVRALPVKVETKFIEKNQAVIETLLSALPESGYQASGLTFASRCGFAEDEPAIRGRFLCPALQRKCGFAVPDVALRVGAWAQLAVPVDMKVVACENKTNFLALPLMDGVLALWGEGGAATGHFPRIRWLRERRLVYWGDLDPCGFSILARLRADLPEVESIFMDQRTCDTHEGKLGTAKAAPQGIAWGHLTEAERSAAQRVATDKSGLEQERLLFAECLAELRQVLAGNQEAGK